MKDNILVFGGGELQLSIIERAMKLGFNTIVIDPDPNAIAKTMADVFFVVAGNDYHKTKNIAEKYNINGVITAATDHPILMMSRIAKELSLPFPSAESCETLLNKANFKTFLKTNHILHAKGDVYDKNTHIDEHSFNYPLIVKPIRNSGSRGVIKCETPQMLKNAIIESLPFCDEGRFIIEEFIIGDEISVEAIVYNHKVEIIQLTDKIVTLPPYNVELGHIQPSKYGYLKESIQKHLQNIIDKSGLNNCAIHPELKINKNGIIVIEIGPRLGGDYITSQLVPLSTGVNIEEIAIKIATNQLFSNDIKDEASLISYLNLPVGKKIKDIISEKELKDSFPEVTKFQLSLSKGDIIKPITNSLNRHGYFIIHGQKLSNLLQTKSNMEDFIKYRLI